MYDKPRRWSTHSDCESECEPFLYTASANSWADSTFLLYPLQRRVGHKLCQLLVLLQQILKAMGNIYNSYPVTKYINNQTFLITSSTFNIMVTKIKYECNFYENFCSGWKKQCTHIYIYQANEFHHNRSHKIYLRSPCFLLQVFIWMVTAKINANTCLSNS